MWVGNHVRLYVQGCGVRSVRCVTQLLSICESASLNIGPIDLPRFGCPVSTRLSCLQVPSAGPTDPCSSTGFFTQILSLHASTLYLVKHAPQQLSCLHRPTFFYFCQLYLNLFLCLRTVILGRGAWDRSFFLYLSTLLFLGKLGTGVWHILELISCHCF